MDELQWVVEIFQFDNKITTNVSTCKHPTDLVTSNSASCLIDPCCYIGKPLFFSRKSDSRIANVCLFVRLSVRLSVTKTPQPLRIAPFNH